MDRARVMKLRSTGIHLRPGVRAAVRFDKRTPFCSRNFFIRFSGILSASDPEVFATCVSFVYDEHRMADMLFCSVLSIFHDSVYLCPGATKDSFALGSPDISSLQATSPQSCQPQP